MRLFALSCAALLYSAAAAAAEVSFPQAFPESSLEATTEIESPGHLVLFSPVREVNNEIRSESMARLPVMGEGRLYEISRDSNREKARDYYVQLLQGRNANILFECRGIRCGRSNVWANQIFGQRVLYGRDATQDYLVAGTVDDEGSRWLTSIYTVTRGNLREYVWVEHLRLTRGASVPGMDRGNSRVLGPIVVPWEGGITYRFDWSANDRRKVLEWAGDSGTQVVITGFSSLVPGQSIEEAFDRAEQAAISLSEVLAKTGVPAERHRIIVAGPAIPFSDPDRQGNRVEVTVVRQP